MPLTLQQVREMQEDFDKRHNGSIPFYEAVDGRNIEALEHLIVCLVGEVGEFANITKKIRRGDHALEEKREELGEELIDSFIYLIKIANQLGIDLESGFLRKTEKNKVKFEPLMIQENSA